MGNHGYFTFLLLLSFMSPAISHQSKDEKAVMKLLPTNANSSFSNATEPDLCTRKGVKCTHNSTHISLHGLNLSNDQFLANVCQLAFLQSLDLSNNLLTAIPELFFTDCGNAKSLKSLNLSRNRLHGSLPSLHAFVSLESLDLSFNSLDRNIGSQLGGLLAIKSLNLSSNLFHGSIPSLLGKSMTLEELQLSHNFFEGAIPKEIFGYQKLRLLDLSSNMLQGYVSDKIGELSELETLLLSYNNLSGEIPASLSRIRKLSELQLGNNNLSGEIPKLPRSLQIALNLSSNHFNGPIPTTLDGLYNLEVLDLSNNGFTGEVPLFLMTLWSLTKLVLSNNHLSGTLPLFRPTVKVVTYGNVNLKQNSIVLSSKRKSTHPAAVIVAAAFAGSALGLGVMVAILFFVLTKHRIRGHLITRDTRHISNIDFTSAMEAVSNQANIMLKCGFSTYYRAIMPCGASYFVKKLNWSDNIIRLGSRERLQRDLEPLGRLRSSYIMSPLAYVLMDDGAYLFYEYAHKGTVHGFLHRSPVNVLDWPRRYSIALGVAHGLSSLHGCSDPVLLFNLSTKTILLKSLKDPQIADVELDKVVDHSKSTPALAGSVGYTPPEYAYTMRVTMAGNVYSFGVILLELLTGKPPVSEGTELSRWVLSNSVENDAWDQILDPRISETAVEACAEVHAEMLSVLKIALSCICTLPEGRPSMRDVVRMLLHAK